MTDKLKLMREPFPANQISYLPKGGVKLAYVGHAALTDRLLDVDPAWQWEPLAFDPDGLPTIDASGGLWIRLTVCGVTRLGYGDAGTKKGGDAMKERIGDALRNAAMRFGAALDLWHKGDLHCDEDAPQADPKPASASQDMRPQARARRIVVGVAAGDAKGAALALSQMDEKTLAEIWEHIDVESQSKLTAAWPVTA